MNVQTKLSAKGQIVIPKDIRDRLGWLKGVRLDVVETADGVLLRMLPERKRIGIAEARERLRELVRYEGPALPIERLSWSADVDREFAERED